MEKAKQLIRFDWAMKRILRDKANFVVLEGFLSVLLREKVVIQKILSSQSNKETDTDKYNDVDILVENSLGELIIIEVQTSKEHDYFHRILFGAAKVITEYIQEGQKYDLVKKVISITIAYFDLGQGADYVYHGTTTFRGLHQGDILTLSERQRELYRKSNVHNIYPEFWIIKAGLFDEDRVNDKLDEWIYFLKTGIVREDFTAPGLPEAKQKLDKMLMPGAERKEYEAYIDRLRRIASREWNEMIEIQDHIQSEVRTAVELATKETEARVAKETEARVAKETEARVAKEMMLKLAAQMKVMGENLEKIQVLTGLSIQEIEALEG